MRAPTTPLIIISIIRFVQGSGLRPVRLHSHASTCHAARKPSAMKAP